MNTPLVHMTLCDECTAGEVWTITVVIQKDDIMYEVGYIQDMFWVFEVECLRCMYIHDTATNFGNTPWGIDLLEKVAKHTPSASSLRSKIQARDQYITVPQAIEMLTRWWMVHSL